MKDFWFVAGFLCGAFVFAAAGTIGKTAVREAMEAEAVKHSAATWSVDVETGKRVFQWKEQTQ